jgi:hypothetical protein
MGRTIPTFSMAIEHEKRRWKPFRNALYDKSDRKEFDKMFDIPRLYTSACSASVQIIRIHPILMSILLHHFKQLTECIEQVKEIEVKVKEEEEEKQGLRMMPKRQVQQYHHMKEQESDILDSYFTIDNNNKMPD